MPKLKPQHLTEPAKRISNKMSKPRLVLYLALATAGLSVGLWLTATVYEPSHPPASVAYYKSLDLAQAKQAIYTNKAITTVRDLGVSDKVRQQLVSFDVPKDGLSEFALMTLPTSPMPKSKYPVIILCHGYANPANYSTLRAYLGDMEFYSQHGFVVIKPDYRGQGVSFTSGTPDGAYYSMSYNTDVMSLIAAVKQTPYLNKKDINLWGHSMGGYIALRAAVLSPDVKSVILLSAPVGNIQDMYSKYTAVSDTANSVAQDIRNEELTAHGTPLSNPDFWNSVSPLDHLAGLRAYVQIHVGSADKTVPPAFSAELNEALTKAHKAHSYYAYNGATHGLKQQSSTIWARSLQVLDKK